MPSIDLLINSGYHKLGDSTTPPECTFLVLGVARSGTSMLAGGLHHLGLFMGRDCARRPAFEDPVLRNYILREDWRSAEKLISEYNCAHQKWGVKIPALINHLESAHSIFRNPHYIVIFRDIFSIANRNRISMKADLFENMHQSLHEYGKIITFLNKHHPPSLLLSQCSALHNKETVVEELVKFCGLSPSERQMVATLNFIEKNPETYLQMSRITKSVGGILSVKDDSIIGWAKYLNSDAIPTVVLSIDGSEVAIAEANIADLSAFGYKMETIQGCGFIIKHIGCGTISKSRISLRVSDDIDDLPYDKSFGRLSLDRSALEKKKRPIWRSLIRKLR